MKTPMARENVFTVALSVATVLVVGILFLEWQQGLQLQQGLTKMRALPVTPVPTQKVLAEFNLPNVEKGFPEFLSRSLFAVSRRSSASAGKGVSSMKKGQFVLVGVLITPQQRSALLRDVQTNKTVTVALVSVVRGMTLGEVESTRVVLRQGAESEELVLNVQAGPKAPVGPLSPTSSAAAGTTATPMASSKMRVPVVPWVVPVAPSGPPEAVPSSGSREGPVGNSAAPARAGPPGPPEIAIQR